MEQRDRKDFFTFRIDQDDRNRLRTLSDQLQRSQSDVLRVLLRIAAHELAPTGVEARSGKSIEVLLSDLAAVFAEPRSKVRASLQARLQRHLVELASELDIDLSTNDAQRT